MTLRAGAFGLVLVCALAGCSSDSGGEPQSLPPVTPAPTTLAPSPTPSPSAYPQTPQGAADFARYVFDAVDRANAAKDPSILRPLFSSDCTACETYLRTAELLESGSFVLSGGTSEVLSAESPGGEGPTVVIARLRTAGGYFTNQAGEVTGREEPANVTSEVELRRSGPSWLVAEIVNVTADGGATP